jgi:hypothetical protein
VVDALVDYGVVRTRKEAVEYGRIVARELNLFHHESGDHAFCDDYLFFRFHSDRSISSGNHHSISSNNRTRPFGGDLGDLVAAAETDEVGELDCLEMPSPMDVENSLSPTRLNARVNLSPVLEVRSSEEFDRSASLRRISSVDQSKDETGGDISLPTGGDPLVNDEKREGNQEIDGIA